MSTEFDAARLLELLEHYDVKNSCREDKFVGLKFFSDGPVAEFHTAWPQFEYEEDFFGQPCIVVHTHFRLDLASLRERIRNLKMPKNYGKVPWSLVNEYAAERAILEACGCIQ